MIRQIVNAYGSQMSEPFAGDRTKTVGASEIGLCARRVAWQKRGTPKDPPRGPKPRAQKQGDKRGATHVEENWGAHIRGSVIERELWVPALRKAFGPALKMAGKNQKTLVSGSLSATPDGIVAGRGHELLKTVLGKVPPRASKDVVVECKTIDPRVSLTEEKRENAYQVQVQMGLIRELTPYKPDYAIISYIDASFWHEVVEFAVPYDPSVLDSARERASKILRADPLDMRPEGWIAGGKECNWCPFLRRCSEARNAVPEAEVDEVDPQFEAELLDLCKQANAIKLRTIEDEAKHREIVDTIKTRLKEKNVRKVDGIVNWYHVKGRESWDIKAMIQALESKGVDASKFSSRGEPTSQLNVSKKVELL